MSSCGSCKCIAMFHSKRNSDLAPKCEGSTKHHMPRCLKLVTSNPCQEAVQSEKGNWLHCGWKHGKSPSTLYWWPQTFIINTNKCWDVPTYCYKIILKEILFTLSLGFLSSKSSASPKRETSYTVAETWHITFSIDYLPPFLNNNDFLFNISISPCYGHKILVDCKSHILSYNLYKIIKPSLWIGFENILNRLSSVESFAMPKSWICQLLS